MLKVSKATKYYGDLLAVDNLSFEVKEGEIFGLLGVNGAGKTTTFRMIMGLLEMTSGDIKLNDQDINYEVLNSVGFLPEERSLLTKMTVEEQVHYIGALKGVKKEEIDKRLDELLKRLEISEYRKRPIKELSKGNQQKIQFIVSIINKPKLLILDEPFSGLDPLNIELFKKKLLELKKEGSIIIFSTHRMDHVEEFCEKIVVLLRGKTVLAGKIKDIKNDYLKKNIFIKGNVNKEELSKIKGVIKVQKLGEDFVVQIESIDMVDNVWKAVAKKDLITKFSVEEPTLNEIFVEKVGEKYEN